MKKELFTTITIIIVIILTYYIYNIHSFTTPPVQNNINLNKNTVSYNGWLHTDGANLKNEKNEIIQLRGLSSHGIEWFSDIITYNNLQTLKDDWTINVFRIAMYTDSHNEGYIYNQEKTKETAYKIIDMAIELDIYVIIDWHILNDNNPQENKEYAKLFFEETSKKYANIPNVIYEICNEPNGDEVTWKKDIAPYCNEIIPIIRNNSKKSLIIVGTPDWCKDLNKAANSPLSFPNIVYACHFYAGTHNEELREKIDYCMKKNIPIFISECGLTTADGNGNLYYNNFNEWINYLNKNNISWVYWNFSNKDESSAILLPEYKILSNTYIDNATTIKQPLENNIQIDINNYLTDSGKFIKKIFLLYK